MNAALVSLVTDKQIFCVVPTAIEILTLVMRIPLHVMWPCITNSSTNIFLNNISSVTDMSLYPQSCFNSTVNTYSLGYSCESTLT